MQFMRAKPRYAALYVQLNL